MLKLRPHHALCMQFFAGKGYSPRFTANMYSVIKSLTPDTEIEITMGPDDLCGHCPNFNGNDCANLEKVTAYDNSVCLECGFDSRKITAEKFFSKARENIIFAGKLRTICGNCKWADICTVHNLNKLI